MQKEILDKLTITNLSCFQNDKVVKVERLTNGYSNTCYLVTTLSNRFVAKRFTNDLGLQKETEVLAINDLRQFVPYVLTKHNQWLIIEFVDKVTLSDLAMDPHKKFTLALNALYYFHRCTEEISNKPDGLFTSLDLFEVISDLKDRAVLTVVAKTIVERAILKIQESEHIASSYSDVLVHGDLNFNNILVDGLTQEYTLLDFEASHIGTVEYDIAMMCSVNEYPITIIEQEIENIRKIFPKINIDLVTRYYVLCCIINALWYLKPTSTCLESDVAMLFQQRGTTQLSLVKALL